MEKKQRHKDQQRNRDYDIVQCTADVTNSVSYIAPWSSEWVLCMSHGLKEGSGSGVQAIEMHFRVVLGGQRL